MKSVGGLGREYLRERPGRAALVTLSVVLGVAVVVAVGSGTATLDRGVDRLGAGIGDADVVVSSAGANGSRLSPEDAAQIATMDGVASSAAVTADAQYIAAVDHPERMLPSALLAVPLEGVDLLVPPAAEGRLPTANDEIGMSQRLSDGLHAGVGDRVTIGSRAYRVAGVLGPGTSDLTGTGRVLVGPPQLVGTPDPALVLVKLSSGVRGREWIAGHSSALPNATMDDASALRSSVRDLFNVINVGFGSMSLLTIGLAGFLIYLALAASVAQRTRDYGVLFALGASRRQVMSTVIGEALAVGVVGSAIGIGAGIVGARLFSAAITSLFGLPAMSLVVPVATIVFGAAVGVGASVVAALIPAVRAARAAPVAAISDVAADAGIKPWRAPIGVMLVATGIAISFLARSSTLNPGTPLVLIGLPMLLPALVPVFTRLARPILRRIAPGVGDVAVASLDAERHRLSLTAGLVTAALTIVVLTGAGYQSIAPQMRRFMQLQFGSDIQVSAPARLGAATLPADYENDARGVSGVRAVTPLWFSETRIEGTDRRRALTVIDTATYFDAAGYSFVDGDQRTATGRLSSGGWVLVNAAVAQERDLHVGDSIGLVVGGQTVGFRVAATYAAFGDDLSRAFVIGRADGDRWLHIGNPNEVRVAITRGVDPHAVAARLPSTTTPVDIRFGADNVEEAMRRFNGVFSMFLVIMAMAGLVGLLGVANTMAISVLQRARQIGMLRAVGTRRREVRNMVLGEAMLLVVVAFLVAIPISAALSASSSSAGSVAFGFKASTHYPWSWLPPILIVTLGAGLLAGVFPARRAARVDPIDALRTE